MVCSSSAKLTAAWFYVAPTPSLSKRNADGILSVFAIHKITNHFVKDLKWNDVAVHHSLKHKKNRLQTVCGEEHSLFSFAFPIQNSGAIYKLGLHICSKVGPLELSHHLAILHPSVCIVQSSFIRELGIQGHNSTPLAMEIRYSSSLLIASANWLKVGSFFFTDEGSFLASGEL